MARATSQMIKSIADEIERIRGGPLAHPCAENAEAVHCALDRIYDDETMTAQEQSDASSLVLYELRWRQHQCGQKRALPLLRRYLTREQRQDLRKRAVFTVIGSAGGTYQLAPHSGAVFGEMHRKPGGKRVYTGARYCYHDPEGLLPSADVALGQMLLIMTDEPKFLAEANKATPYRGRQSAIPPRVGGAFVCQIPEWA